MPDTFSTSTSGVSSPKYITSSYFSECFVQKSLKSFILSLDPKYIFSEMRPTVRNLFLMLPELPPVIIPTGYPFITAIRMAKASLASNIRYNCPSRSHCIPPSVITPSISKANAFILLKSIIFIVVRHYFLNLVRSV